MSYIGQREKRIIKIHFRARLPEILLGRRLDVCDIGRGVLREKIYCYSKARHNQKQKSFTVTFPFIVGKDFFIFKMTNFVLIDG